MENPNTKYLAENFPEIEPMQFYRELFPAGELEQRGEYLKGVYHGVAVQVVGKKRAKRYSICDDLHPIDELIQQDEFLIISPVSYCGKQQVQKNARFLYALAFDVDGLIIKDGEPQGLKNLIHQCFNAEFHPIPTYIVSSGNGVHLYYLLEKPLALFPNVMKQLHDYRTYFTKRIWNEYVTTLSKEPQFESVTQSFRAVGSICKDGVNRVRAFKCGERVSIEYLNSRVGGLGSPRFTDFAYKSELTLRQAQEKFPDWYERRIEQKQPRGAWTCKQDLYDWWLRQIKSGATVGHRFYCVMCLAVYARKCAVRLEQLERDAYSLLLLFDSKSPADGSNDFTDEDIAKALEAYSADYITFPRDTISELSAIPIQANKRNYRKQELHLRGARAIQEINDETGLWRNKNGAPTKKDAVISYYLEHKTANHSEIANALGVSRPTVIKWLKWYRDEQSKSGDE